MAKQMIGTRIPESWIVRLKELSESTGMSQSDLIYQAVAKLIGEDVSDVRDRIEVIEAEVETIKQRLGKLTAALDRIAELEGTIAHQPPTIQKQPSEDARQAVPARSLGRSIVQGDKASCPACGLSLTRREGYGKVCRLGENAGRRKQRWTCLNPKCDRCGKSFLGGWAD